MRNFHHEEKRIVWEGDRKMEGIHQFFEYLEGKRYKMHVRVFLSRYRSPSSCPVCQGNSPSPTCTHGTNRTDQNIHEVSQWPIQHVHAWLQALTLSPFEREIASDLLKVLQAKLSFLLQVRIGLPHHQSGNAHIVRWRSSTYFLGHATRI